MILLFGLITFLTTLFLYLANKKILGIRLHVLCKSDTLMEKMIIFFIIFSIFSILIDFSYLIISQFFDVSPFYVYVNEPSSSNTVVNTSGSVNINNNNQDPVRFWPSGSPQAWTIFGIAAAAYKATPGSHRQKATAAAAVTAVTLPVTLTTLFVENPNGFRNFLYQWIEYQKTGRVPKEVPNNLTVDELGKKIQDKITEINNNKKNFINNDFFNNFDLETIINNNINTLFSFFKPAPIEGYLADLIGQQLILHILLFILTLGLIMLFFYISFLIVLFYNKDYFLNLFNNKFYNFYIKYQYILLRISLIYLPIIFFIGLIQLLITLYFLITHTLPIEAIPVDPLTYVVHRPINK